MIFSNSDAQYERMERIIESIRKDTLIVACKNYEEVKQVLNEITIDLFLIISLHEYECPFYFMKEIRERVEYYCTPMILIDSKLEHEMYAYRDLQVYAFFLDTYDVFELKNSIYKALSERRKTVSEEVITYKTKREVHHFSLHEIIYLEIINKKLVAHSFYGKKVLTGLNMRSFIESKGESPFEQCHRCYAINTRYVRNFNLRENKLILMGTNAIIPVGRKYRPDIIERLSANS